MKQVFKDILLFVSTFIFGLIYEYVTLGEPESIEFTLISTGIITTIVFVFVKSSYAISAYRKRKGTETELGVLKIKYEADGNEIKLFRGGGTFSLVINNKVVSEYGGFFPSKACLKGEIKTEEKTITVEVKFKTTKILLYCDGEIVAQKRSIQ